MEKQAQNVVLLESSRRGWILWRNNTGVAVTAEGRHVRYGLCNESKAVNSHMKSSDLIGLRPVVITPDMVGQTIGQFIAIEMKDAGWKYSGTPREEAQLRFINLVKKLGGYARFSTGEL